MYRLCGSAPLLVMSAAAMPLLGQTGPTALPAGTRIRLTTDAAGTDI